MAAFAEEKRLNVTWTLNEQRDGVSRYTSQTRRQVTGTIDTPMNPHTGSNQDTITQTNTTDYSLDLHLTGAYKFEQSEKVKVSPRFYGEDSLKTQKYSGRWEQVADGIILLDGWEVGSGEKQRVVVELDKQNKVGLAPWQPSPRQPSQTQASPRQPSPRQPSPRQPSPLLPERSSHAAANPVEHFDLQLSSARRLMGRLDQLKANPSTVKEKVTRRELLTLLGEVLEFVSVNESSCVFAGSSEAENRLETVKQLAQLQIDQRCSDLEEAVQKLLQRQEEIRPLRRPGSQAAIARATLETKLGAEEKTGSPSVSG